MLDTEILSKFKNDTITNDELASCLKSNNRVIIAQSMLKIIERDCYKPEMIGDLIKIGNRKGIKVIGTYQLSHMAMVIFHLQDDAEAKAIFQNLYNGSTDSDKFLVDNYIKQLSEKR